MAELHRCADQRVVPAAGMALDPLSGVRRSGSASQQASAAVQTKGEWVDRGGGMNQDQPHTQVDPGFKLRSCGQ